MESDLIVLFNLSPMFPTHSLLSVLSVRFQLSRLIIGSQKNMVERELAALGINLSAHPDTAAAFCEPETLHMLIKRCHQFYDPLLMKLIRNLSQFGSNHEAFRVSNVLGTGASQITFAQARTYHIILPT